MTQRRFPDIIECLMKVPPSDVHLIMRTTPLIVLSHGFALIIVNINVYAYTFRVSSSLRETLGLLNFCQLTKILKSDFIIKILNFDHVQSKVQYSSTLTQRLQRLFIMQTLPSILIASLLSSQVNAQFFNFFGGGHQQQQVQKSYEDDFLDSEFPIFDPLTLVLTRPYRHL